MYVAACRAKNGSENTPPAYIARFFKAALQALYPGCMPATNPPSRRPSSPEPAEGAGTGQADRPRDATAPSINLFAQVQSAVRRPFHLRNPACPVADLSLNSQPALHEEVLADLPLDALAQDLTYWDSLNSVQASSSWAWLDQALNSAIDAAGAPAGGF